MKGANAVVSAKIINAPKRMSITKSGSSQNFLRTRRNLQNSPKNDMIVSSKLIGHFGFVSGTIP
jgi:hypothetical protein